MTCPSHGRAALLAALVFAAVPVSAHHGWNWTTGENVELTGTITGTRLGYPHGEVDLDVDGERYTVEVGQPWRNDRAGLDEDDFAQGREIRVEGEVPSDSDARVLKVERLWLDGELHELYPDRE